MQGSRKDTESGGGGVATLCRRGDDGQGGQRQNAVPFLSPCPGLLAPSQGQTPNTPLRESALGKGRQEVLGIQAILKPLQQDWALGLTLASYLASEEYPCFQLPSR